MRKDIDIHTGKGLDRSIAFTQSPRTKNGFRGLPSIMHPGRSRHTDFHHAPHRA